MMNYCAIETDFPKQKLAHDYEAGRDCLYYMVYESATKEKDTFLENMTKFVQMSGVPLKHTE